MFSLISRTGKRKVSTVTSRCPEQCASIFFFVPIFFFLISRKGEKEVSVVPTPSSVHYTSIFVFLYKKISSISRYLKSQR